MCSATCLMLEPHSFKPKHLFFFLIFILRPDESNQWGQPHFVKWNVEPDHDGKLGLHQAKLDWLAGALW